jgi:TldD protein
MLSCAALSLDTKAARQIQSAMRKELARAEKGLHVRGHPRPFFISFLLSRVQGLSVWGRYGAVFGLDPIDACDLYAEVRVGGYRFDQTIDGGLTNDLSARESYKWSRGPRDTTPDAVRYAFWKLSQLKYWEAVQEYYEKKKILVDQHLRADSPSFSREPAVVKNRRIEAVKFPTKNWEEFVRKSSAFFKEHRDLVDPYVRVHGVNRVRIFVSSEGTRFIVQERYYFVIVTAYYLTKEGVYLNSTRLFYGRDPQELPTLGQMKKAVAWVARDLESLAKSEPMDPYAGPALLSGKATGLLFHEAIGHRLEGERMTSRLEGHTFAAKIGQRILPESVDVIDDPTRKRWDGQSLFGHYEIDDEGVESRPVRLVENGVLKTFLLSRSCVLGFRRSNGHGRHELHQDPMARMASFIVESREKHSWEELKELLIAEVRRRDLRFGIIVKDVSSGETRTDHYDFQAFKGVPTEVYTVDPKTGKETRVRDVSFIGTPLAAIQRIKAFGRDYQVDNSYCIAESGEVPVSTIAPAMLVEELELQRSTNHYFRRPTLALPPMRP